MRTIRTWAFAALVAFPLETIQVCGEKITAEVAATPAQLRQGLMHRSHVPPGTGMLFTYPDERVRFFWMKNVPMDIDIGFFDLKNRLVHHLTMRGTDPKKNIPDSELPQYSSAHPAKAAVELEAGFFERIKKMGKLKGCRLTF